MTSREHLLEQIADGMSDFSRTDLSHISLDNVDIDGSRLLFSDVDFSHTSFKNARFSRTNFVGSKFIEADLSGATFDSCLLVDCDLFESTCRDVKFFGCSLENACLVSADFRDTLFFGTDFDNALIGNTDFSRAHLGAVRHLETVHYGDPHDDEMRERILKQFRVPHLPAIIDMETIALSAEIFRLIQKESEEGISTEDYASPEIFVEFLRNNGVREAFIDAYRSLVQPQSNDYESVFISYSTRDQPFADFLYEQLRLRGIRTWYAPKDMLGGKQIMQQIRSAIGSSDRVLLILSAYSIGSDWVANELRLARRREQEGRNVLFPLRLTSFEELQKWEFVDSDTGQDLSHYIRSYYIPDFSNWTNRQAASRELERLTNALKKQ